MKIEKDTNILIVGLGMIGGSYARGLTKEGYHVNAIDCDQETVDYAIENKMIQKGTVQVDRKLIGEADLVIFALYPHIFREWIGKNQWYFKSGALITDVTGVKGRLVYDIQDKLRDDCEYIAAHPMAGCEKLGIWHSDETIFYDANYIVVPTDKNTEEAVAACRQIGQILHFARISELDPYEHDEMIGFVSQLTHCIAMSLMTCDHTENLEDSYRRLFPGSDKDSPNRRDHVERTVPAEQRRPSPSDEAVYHGAVQTGANAHGRQQRRHKGHDETIDSQEEAL